MKNIISGLVALVGIITFVFLDGPSLIEKYFSTPKVNVVKSNQTEEKINSGNEMTKTNNVQDENNESESYNFKTPSEVPIKTSIAISEAINFHSYINSSIINSPDYIDVSVVIVNNSDSPAISESDAIANIYKKTGKIGNIGLFRNSFYRKSEFSELLEGNSDIIEKLNLKAYTDYLALGKINYSMRPGTLVNGTIICNASISMSIISTHDRSIAQSFTISNANGNGATESQAQENALQKLLDKYYNEHSSL